MQKILKRRFFFFVDLGAHTIQLYCYCRFLLIERVVTIIWFGYENRLLKIIALYPRLLIRLARLLLSFGYLQLLQPIMNISIISFSSIGWPPLPPPIVTYFALTPRVYYKILFFSSNRCKKNNNTTVNSREPYNTFSENFTLFSICFSLGVSAGFFCSGIIRKFV